MTIEKALNLFYIGRKLNVIIITPNGGYNERPIGIITTADILDMNAVLENYEVDAATVENSSGAEGTDIE